MGGGKVGWAPQEPSATHRPLFRRRAGSAEYVAEIQVENASNGNHGRQSWVDLPSLNSGDIVLRQTRQIGEPRLRQSGLLARLADCFSEMRLQFGAVPVPAG